MSANPRLGPHRKCSRHHPCPMCGGTTSYCLIFDDGATICGRVESDRPAGIGWMHNVAERDWRDDQFPVIRPIPRIRRADPATLDAVFRAVLARLPLSTDHRADLERRDMRPERITSGLFGTLPQTGRSAIAHAIVEDFGVAVAASTPGLYRRRDNRGQLYWTIAGRPGLLIAIPDAEGRICLLYTSPSPRDS